MRESLNQNWCIVLRPMNREHGPQLQASIHSEMNSALSSLPRANDLDL
ncbi:unnamed protein product, partial [Vitis vinifera]|uniref:Uncharacterized protein n=1 Tax=Vitis vinifera TaxID=29760 RepID=D7T1Y9_VITVI